MKLWTIITFVFRAISVPSSPVEGKTNIARAKPNPFFIPSKEPPKYDEAVKNMHNLAQVLTLRMCGYCPHEMF